MPSADARHGRTRRSRGRRAALARRVVELLDALQGDQGALPRDPGTSGATTSRPPRSHVRSRRPTARRASPPSWRSASPARGLVELRVVRHRRDQRELAALPVEHRAPELVRIGREHVVRLGAARRSTTAPRARPRAARAPSPSSRRRPVRARRRARRGPSPAACKRRCRRSAGPRRAARSSSTSTTTASGCTGPPT